MTFVLLAAGIITAALGFVALLGWVLGLPLLASFGTGRMPMAPSTAVLFLLFGAAICSRARTPLSDRAFRISRVAGGLLALVALLLFVLSSLNIHPDLEHFGANITGTVGGAGTGHMSPVSAFCFLLAVVSFLASLSRSATRRWRITLALGSAGVLLGTAYIFLLAYFFGTPLLYGGNFIPPALNTLLALSTMALALLVLASRAGGLPGRAPATGDRTAWHFFLIFVVLTVGIVTTAYIYYRSHEQAYRVEVERQLSAITDLKVGELTQWREDRLGDAAIFSKNPSFTALVRRFFAQPADADAQRQLQDWLGKYTALDDYDQVRLLDTQAVTRLSLPGGLNPASSNTVRATAEALRSGQITIQDFYRHEHNQRVYLSVQVPILDESDTNRPLGVLVLRMDPTKYLYLFIQRWPTPSKSAETLLLRREGNEVLYLNDLRHQSNAALALRLPLTRTVVPAVTVALGQTGIMPGVDHRGVPVLAVGRAVPDSPWFMVAKIDRAEVYAPLRAQLWQTVVLVGVLLFGAGVGVGLVWRQQRVRFYRKEAVSVEVLRESDERFHRALAATNEGLWEWNILTNQSFHSERWCEILGYAADDPALPHTYDAWAERIHPDDAERVQRHLQEHLEKNTPFAIEYRHRHKSGEYRWQSSWGVTQRDVRGNPTKMTGCIADITERKRGEAELRASEERHRTILQTATDGFWLVDLQGRLLEVNDAYCRMSGYSAQELLAMRISDLEANQTVEQIAASIQKVKAEGEARFETRHRCKDGSLFDVALGIQYRPAAGGQFVVFLHDITARKRTAAELQQQLDELRRWQAVMLGTADRSMKLKCEVNELLRRLGEPVRYPSQAEGAGGGGEVTSDQ